MLVCIDAGHAKNTAGKRSIDSTLREYEFNRAVAKLIRGQLERHGVSVIYSCDLETPEDISLTARSTTANKAKADIFVSIHANAYGADWNSANGWEIFYAAGSTKGHKLAQVIHAESIPFLGLRDRGIKTANFAVLTQTSMPAVLIEHGFYTNKDECAKLKDLEFRTKCAVADAKGILAYLGIAWIEENEQSKKTELETVEEIVDYLGQLGIITDPELWLAKLNEDRNAYWLARKCANHIKYH